MTCPSCGHDAPSSARFCPACGHGLSPTRGEERRVVTVLFADLVGFTALSESEDPEKVKLLVDGCFQRLVADVNAFGGRVDKILGDAIIALFGAPIAHEDDAERAVRAALRMQRTLHDHAADLPTPVRMRVGVNTGEVLVGALRAGGDYTAMGDVVNTANRLQTVAPPGGVLVGAATHAATSAAIRYDHVGPVEARGREEPVDAWLALEAVAPPGRRPRRAKAPLVGRDTELTLLLDGIRLAVRHDRPFLAVVEGEGGVGKNRLVEEVCREAERQLSAIVLQGRCAPYGEVNPWWPIATALSGVLCLDPSIPAEESTPRCADVVSELLDLPPTDDRVGTVVEGLLQMGGHPTRLDDIEPARAREHVQHAVLALLEGLVRRRPLVLAVADLQWADPMVGGLLERALGQLSGSPFTLLTTQRPDRANTWPPATGRHTALVLRLDPLQQEAADQLLQLLVTTAVPEELRQRLIDRSGGNPFFIEELATLVEEGSPAVELLPDTLRGLVAARLDALPPAQRAMLDNAAVLGSWGSWISLQKFGAAMGQQADVATLAELADADLLDIEGDQWSFRSESVREVAYATLTKTARAQRHAGVANELRASFADRPERAEQIAFHYAAAAELVQGMGSVPGVPGSITGQAVTWLLHAAEWNVDQQVLPTAERLATQALELLANEGRVAADDPQRVRALIVRGRAYGEQRDLDRARQDIVAALDGARLAGDPGALSRARTVLGNLERAAGRMESSVRELSHAVQLARQAGDELARADALRQLGMTALFSSDPEGAERHFDEADRIYSSLGDRRGHAWIEQHRAWISFVRGETGEAERRLAGAAAAFVELGDRGGLGWVNGLLAYVRFQQGRRAEARALAEETVREADQRGDRWAVGMMRTLLAAHHLWEGRPDEALGLATEARDTFRAIGERYGEIQACAPLARALVAKGRVADALRLAEEAMRFAEPFGMERFGATIAAGAAVHAGDGERAVRQARLALDSVDDFEGYDLEARVALGFGLVQVGRPAAAIDVLEDAAAHHASRPYLLVARALALAAAGKPAEAVSVAAAVVDDPAASYLDAVIASCVVGLAKAQQGDEDGSRDGIAEAVRRSDASGDLVARAVARLARAEARVALGDPEADELRGRAAARASRFEGALHGWTTAFALAAHFDGEPEVVA
jgi:class 3 adenylate cyclase/tetratricopeptide (TPR) repeat protein